MASFQEDDGFPWDEPAGSLADWPGPGAEEEVPLPEEGPQDEDLFGEGPENPEEFDTPKGVEAGYTEAPLHEQGPDTTEDLAGPEIRGPRREAIERGKEEASGERHHAIESMVAATGVDPDVWFRELERVNDELHERRRDLSAEKAQLARLESEYGSVGNMPNLWDHDRKALLAKLVESRRSSLEGENAQRSAAFQAALRAQAGEYEEREGVEPAAKTKKAAKLPEPELVKITESGLESWAHAHPEYLKFLSDAKENRKQYEDGRAKMDEIWADIHHLVGKKDYLESRIRMVEEQIRYGRAVANLGRG